MTDRIPPSNSLELVPPTAATDTARRSPRATVADNPTEESMFHGLYWSQYRQGSGVCRHASVGEPYLPSSVGRPERAQHGVRRIDALIIRRNVAKGDALWAVEIKVTAADLRHELAQPEKTAAWAQYVHAFYFLVPDALADIALAEIPSQYGVMVGDRYPQIKRRAKRNPNPLPLPLDTWRRITAKLGEHQIENIDRARRPHLERRHPAGDNETLNKMAVHALADPHPAAGHHIGANELHDVIGARFDSAMEALIRPDPALAEGDRNTHDSERSTD